MINNFTDFCTWVYVTVDDIWQEIAPLFDHPVLKSRYAATAS